MWKKIKDFYQGWQEHIESQQNLEAAYRYCKLYGRGKISEETFNKLIDSLDGGKE